MEKEYFVWLLLEEKEGEDGRDIEAIKIGRYTDKDLAFKYMTQVAEREDSEREYTI